MDAGCVHVKSEAHTDGRLSRIVTLVEYMLKLQQRTVKSVGDTPQLIFPGKQHSG